MNSQLDLEKCDFHSKSVISWNSSLKVDTALMKLVPWSQYILLLLPRIAGTRWKEWARIYIINDFYVYTDRIVASVCHTIFFETLAVFLNLKWAMQSIPTELNRSDVTTRGNGKSAIFDYPIRFLPQECMIRDETLLSPMTQKPICLAA